jgi:uncharacterized protein
VFAGRFAFPGARPRASVRRVSATITVKDNAEAERFEIAVEGEVAGFAQYRRRPELIAFVHTEVEPRFSGQGLASRLISASLDSARAEGLAVLPFCPFVNAYIERHPEYADLVPEAFRTKFGL